MKIGIISDIHGNDIALEEALFILQKKIKVADIYFLGDAVGYLPEGNQVINRLRAEKVNFLMGNHEAMLLGHLPLPEEPEKMYRLTEARLNISKVNKEFLQTLQSSKNVLIKEQKLLLVHGSPENPLNGYVYPDTDLSGMYTGMNKYIFMGHTHRPFIKENEGVTLVNVGSCGLPRDAGDLASFAVLDLLTEHVNVYRFALNIEKIIKQYGSFIHPDVIACFKRPYDKNTICGEILTD